MDLIQVEKIYKALANRRRLAIILYLHKIKKATVADISDHIDLSFTATSKHLQILKSVDFTRSNQTGLEQHYYLSDFGSKFTKNFMPVI